MDVQRIVDCFLTRLGERLGTPLTLQRGVCALYNDRDQQLAVIEIPQPGRSIMFYCRLGQVAHEVDGYQRLLASNFNMSSMRGCWFALSRGALCLCTQRDIAELDEERFCDLAMGFIAQAQAIRDTL
nr:type III secretion system chaperone [uncultured Pseudomonas sp.]